MVVPDYQMLGYVEKIASQLSDDPVTVCHLHLLSIMFIALARFHRLNAGDFNVV